MGRRILTSAAVLVAGLALAWNAAAQQFPFARVEPYLNEKEIPNAVVFLPPPPEEGTPQFAYDEAQYQWGKTQRVGARALRAIKEETTNVDSMAALFSGAFGRKLSRQTTPKTMHLLDRSIRTFRLGASGPKAAYMRLRPYVFYREGTLMPKSEEGSRRSGSYPSGHTTRGMAVALVLAEMAPEFQDTILRRGFEYGESRIIVSAHYQSDVNAGYLCASACVAAMHSVPDFIKDMEAARVEYYEKIGQKAGKILRYPDGRHILSTPVDTASNRYLGDVMRYMSAKAERTTQRGSQALKDADITADAILEGFSEPLGIKIDSKKTPAIAALISESRNALQRNALDLGNSVKFRKRPYVQLNDKPFADANDSQVSSYPSVQSEIGWGIALILTEIAPDKANDILTRGYQIGESGIITGQYWATDIPAARIMAACMVARLHNDAAFNKLLNDAKAEYQK